MYIIIFISIYVIYRKINHQTKKIARELEDIRNSHYFICCKIKDINCDYYDVNKQIDVLHKNMYNIKNIISNLVSYDVQA